MQKCVTVLLCVFGIPKLLFIYSTLYSCLKVKIDDDEAQASTQAVCYNETETCEEPINMYG